MNDEKYRASRHQHLRRLQENALAAFEKAAVEHAMMGELPLMGCDEEENVAIQKERTKRISRYKATQTRLKNLFEAALSAN